MKKLTFIDSLTSKSCVIYWMIGIMLAGELIRLLLMMYQGDNQVLKYMTIIFTPYLNIHIFWRIILVMAPFTMLIYIEYFYRKLAGE